MKPLPGDLWDPSLQHVVDDMNGKPVNVHALMANHPDLLNAWWSFRKYAVSGGELSRRQCELVILRVAVHMRAWYEWGSHVDRGLSAGLSIDEINRIPLTSSDWSEDDALLLETVDQLIENRGINSEMQVALSRHFSNKQIMDVIAIHGMYITLGCMINTWGLELDGSVRERLPADVTREVFERQLSSANSN